GVADVMVMVAQGYAQNFLGLLLFNDEPVEKIFHLARLVFEFEFLFRRLSGRFLRFDFLLDARESGDFGSFKMLAHEVPQLALKFFRRGRAAKNIVGLLSHNVSLNVAGIW